MSNDHDVDWDAVKADIVAYWASLQSHENPNGIWYLATGDLNNLIDEATDEIERLRSLVVSMDAAGEVLKIALTDEERALLDKAHRLV